MRSTSMRFGVCVMVGLLTAASLVPATPARASVTGVLGIECTAHLPNFPSSITRSGTCGNGLIPSLWAGGAVTMSNGHVLIPNVGAVGGFSATFDYNEQCILNAPPVIGSADGRGAKGAFVPVTVLPEFVDDVLHIEFTWSRVGLTALIVVTKATLGDGTTTLLNSAGAAVGAFAPLLGPNNVCGNPSGDGGPMQAIVLAAGGPVA